MDFKLNDESTHKRQDPEIINSYGFGFHFISYDLITSKPFEIGKSEIRRILKGESRKKVSILSYKELFHSLGESFGEAREVRREKK